MRRLAWPAIYYLTIGYGLGFVLQKALPAMNLLGVSWYALMWPWMVANGCFGAHGTIYHLGVPDPPIPAWCFTFK